MKARADPNYGITWMYIPDSQGILHEISLNYTASRHDKKYDYSSDKASFWLYTNIKCDFVQDIKDAYLKIAGYDYNIIVVDWKESASDNVYIDSVYATKTIGEFVGHVINHMHAEHDVDLSDVHIIGYSLGAHVAGIAGSVFQSLSGKSVGRITGLDPAFPYFEDTSKINTILDSSDADFVDVIHTCAGMLGHDENLGHVDFYPNGGTQVQPGCDFILDDYFGACSHDKSFKYFVATIIDPCIYMGRQCSSFKHFKKQKCSGEEVRMGDAVPQNARGEYYLSTRRSDL
ncbi:pancreatic triacylglycerol lipase-like [Chironomus tepperi]|uniref:pancreatic triacylglycerol lipase-like n=1 Tax=Chironomus tepperi TaxID=113505 RepID=UPI00391F81D0